ncbi:MAG: hypothetical protein GKR90_01775 [Pseudomonadales bacterium]|nr:hypothetical protein [Pseudomonadales bacterium]
MPFYNDLRPPADYETRDYALVFPKMTPAEKKRTIEGLLRLRGGFANLPAKRADQNLLIASWNIKEFGHTNQRLPEAFFYIAEIIAQFDLVAVQELKSGMADLELLMRILGSDWDFIVNDITNGTDGNSERSAYLFNKERVQLSGLAGEITLWDELTAGSAIKQLKRAPYLTGFKSGWKTFAMINLHLHPGDDADDLALRGEDVRLLLAAIAEKIARNQLWSRNLILVGDFNFYDADEATIRLIEGAGFFEIQGLKGIDTNASLTEAYDRFFLTRNDYFQVVKNSAGTDRAGVFTPFMHVYQTGEHATYREEMLEDYTGAKDLANDDVALERYYRHPWRKNQVSDHFPIWFELTVDSSETFLRNKLAQLEAL